MKIRFKNQKLIYKSNRLIEIDRFAADSGLNAMVINAQTFVNARGEVANRISDR